MVCVCVFEAEVRFVGGSATCTFGPVQNIPSAKQAFRPLRNDIYVQNVDEVLSNLANRLVSGFFGRVRGFTA